MSNTRWTDAFLNQARLRGDKLADRALSEATTPWPDTTTNVSDQTVETVAKNFYVIQRMIDLLKPLTTNSELRLDEAAARSADRATFGIVHFLNACAKLPSWADKEKMARAEELFEDNGVLSCVLFFCSSLPEVYVVPDVSMVLHATGNLERVTDQRIRSTAIMILTVMLPGGLHADDGGGLPQIMKARLIHSVIRNTILRSNPEDLLAKIDKNRGLPVVPPLPGAHPPRSMLEMTFANGWDPSASGVPCNQEEMAYTLLTFSYVYLRSLRRLGLALAPADEEAYLHCWNVIGWTLGIDDDMLAHTMKEASTLFKKIQLRARAMVIPKDPRPSLGLALMNSIERSIRFEALKPMAALITQLLTSRQTAKDLGITSRITWPAKIWFTMFSKSVRVIDCLAKRIRPQFSISRLIVRVVGYQLLHKVLTDKNQPMDLPEHLRNQISRMLHDWSHDPKAPKWMNDLEDYLTTHGSWSHTLST